MKSLFLFSNKLTVLLLTLLVLITIITPAHPSRAQTNTGGILNFAEPVTAELPAGAQASWLFNGRAQQRITLSLERFPADQATAFDPYLELQAPDGTLIAVDDDGGPNKDALILGMVLPADGLYTIQVKSFDDFSGGTYQLTLVENTLPAGCESLQGTVVESEWFYSPIGREDLRYRVYLPPCYVASERRYPYILLMHGSNSSDEHWQRLGIDKAITRGVALGDLPPVAVVLPYGGVIANTNIFYIDGSYEYVILKEIMPMVEASFCLQQEPSGRAIGGISRGGFWAYLIGLRHPDLFAAIGGHSPFFDLYHAPDSHNPLALAQSVQWTDELPRLYMDRGKDDYAQVNIDLMSNRLTENGLPYTYVLHPTGEHRDEYWGAHLDEYLEFYTANWNEGIATFPLCEISGGGLSTAESQ